MADTRIIKGDFVAWLRGHQWMAGTEFMPRYHAVIADPPYALEFMGRGWDAFDTPQHYQAWVTSWARLLLDFVYPGAILMMFGGTRTYHRLAAGLEDAGWILADSMVWMYGSGFPKAADLGKMIDKEAGAAREVVGEKTVQGGWHHDHTMNDDGWTGGAQHITAPATAAAKAWDGYKTALKPAYEPIVVARAPRAGMTFAQLAQQYGTGALNVDAGRVTANADYYDHNHGVRYGASSMQQMGGHQTRPYIQRRIDAGLPVNTSVANVLGRYPSNVVMVCACERDDGTHADGCPVAELDRQSGESVSTIRDRGDDYANCFGGIVLHDQIKRVPAPARGHDDFGGASRFFYQAKASTGEREWGLRDFDARLVNDGRVTDIDNAYQRGTTARKNTLPTVKPIQLIGHLARLILPPKLETPRRLLIPFSGSGSEVIGAMLAGWDEIDGIEREAEYIAIAEARIRWWAGFKSYDEARRAAAKKTAVVKETPGTIKPIQMVMFG